MNGMFLKRLTALLTALLLLGVLAGCGSGETAPTAEDPPSESVSAPEGNVLYRPSSVNYSPPGNTYMPPTDEDGFLVVTMPSSIIEIAGITAEELAADFRAAAPPDERITDIRPNEDGSADYLFTPEQFEIFKRDTYDTGCYEYGSGSFPQSVKTVEYTEIDENGIPWAAVVSVDYAVYTESPMNELLGYTYAMAWPANYIGQYQIFSGVPADSWNVHMTMKNADTGEILLEQDFPAREQ